MIFTSPLILLVFTQLNNFSKAENRTEVFLNITLTKNGTYGNESSDNTTASLTLFPKNGCCPYKTCSRFVPSLEVNWNFNCDKKCHEYKTCCSTKERESNKTRNCMMTGTINYETAMISSCPPNYISNDHIKKFCQNPELHVPYDVWLMTPVDDFKMNVTFQNVFCAACSGSTLENISFWELRLHCTKKDTGIEELFENVTINQNELLASLWPRDKGFWIYKSKVGMEYHCFLHPKGDENSKIPKTCTPSPTYTIISEVPAASHNVACTNMKTSKLALRLNNDIDRRPLFSRCSYISQSEHAYLYEITCSKQNYKNNKCIQKSAPCTTSEYHYHKTEYTSKKTPANTIDSKFADDEWYMLNKTHVFVCGPRVSYTISTTWAYVWAILLFLLKASLVGLVLYFLIFLWLPEKIVLDKNLAILGFTLFIQILCVVRNYENSLISCRIIATLWHYSLLSSFMWILILSYDCWLSLYQLFKIYQLVGEFDQTQFLIYVVVGQAVPLAATGAALSFGSSPAEFYCQKELGLDKYECLLSQVPGFKLYFFIPASIFFVWNIYYLGRIGHLIFWKQNSNDACQKFKKRSGLPMMIISPIWMVGSLIMLTHYEFPICDFLIYIVHVFQVYSFLTLVFHRMMDRLMRKFDEIEISLFGDPQYDPTTTTYTTIQNPVISAILGSSRSEHRENQHFYLQRECVYFG